MQQFGFLVDLLGHQFDDSVEPQWIQAMPFGKWEHPIHGTIDITPERAARFADNVNRNVRGQDLDIDFDHKERSGEASGWVKQAEARHDGLYLAVAWTKDALQKIKDGAYRYFSPEFVDEWTHPATKQTFKDVLFGGALTNRPFLKGILPINLSEVVNANEGASKVTLRQKYGLPETATDEEVEAAIQAKAAEGSSTPPPSGSGGTDPNAQPPASSEGGTQPPPTQPVGSGTEGDPVQASESTVIKLADGSTKTLGEVLAEQNRLTTALRLSEVNQAVAKLNEGKFKLTPACSTKLSEVLIQSPKALSDKVIELMGEVIKDGIMEFGERGGSRSGGGESAAKQFSDAVDKAVTEKKLSYADAVELVGREDPELYDRYRNETMKLQEV